MRIVNKKTGEVKEVRDDELYKYGIEAPALTTKDKVRNVVGRKGAVSLATAGGIAAPVALGLATGGVGLIPALIAAGLGGAAGEAAAQGISKEREADVRDIAKEGALNVGGEFGGRLLSPLMKAIPGLGRSVSGAGERAVQRSAAVPSDGFRVAAETITEKSGVTSPLAKKFMVLADHPNLPVKTKANIASVATKGATDDEIKQFARQSSKSGSDAFQAGLKSQVSVDIDDLVLKLNDTAQKSGVGSEDQLSWLVNSFSKLGKNPTQGDVLRISRNFLKEPFNNDGIRMDMVSVLDNFVPEGALSGYAAKSELTKLLRIPSSPAGAVTKVTRMERVPTAMEEIAQAKTIPGAVVTTVAKGAQSLPERLTRSAALGKATEKLGGAVEKQGSRKLVQSRVAPGVASRSLLDLLGVGPYGAETAPVPQDSMESAVTEETITDKNGNKFIQSSDGKIYSEDKNWMFDETSKKWVSNAVADSETGTSDDSAARGLQMLEDIASGKLKATNANVTAANSLIKQQGSSARPLSVGAAKDIAGAKAARLEIEEFLPFFESHKNVVGLRNKALLGYFSKDKAELDNRLKALTQTVGKALEGGRFTDTDREFYQKQIQNTASLPYENAVAALMQTAEAIDARARALSGAYEEMNYGK